MLEHKLIPGRFYGGSVQGHFSLSSIVQPGASIMRKMNREVLGSNPGPDRKNVRIGFRPLGIPWGVNSRSQLQIPIRLGSRLWNDKQTNQHYCFCPDFSTVRTHLLTQLGIDFLWTPPNSWIPLKFQMTIALALIPTWVSLPKRR